MSKFMTGWGFSDKNVCQTSLGQPGGALRIHTYGYISITVVLKIAISNVPISPHVTNNGCVVHNYKLGCLSYLAYGGVVYTNTCYLDEYTTLTAQISML